MPVSVRKIIGDLSEEVKVLLALRGGNDRARETSGEGGIGNIGKLCGSHRLDSSGGKWLVHKQHGSERLCQGGDRSRRSRVYCRSEQLPGDGFHVYGHARGNLTAASRARRGLFVCRQS